MFNSPMSLGVRSVSPPQAFSFIPSQNWDGNDGAWSSFVIRVGTPSQYFRVLPSVSSPSTYLPLPLNCSENINNCGNARGVEPFKSPSTAVSTNVSLIDPGLTCSANRGPSCYNCYSVEGKCTDGPCAGQFCCGGTAGSCNSAGCDGVSNICTHAYVGCPCIGDDYDAGTSVPKDPGAANPSASLGFWGGMSSSWNALSNTTLSVAGTPPDISGNGSFGLDTIGLGPTSDAGLNVSQKTLVAGVSIDSFFLGSLGLQPSNGSQFDDMSPSLLTNLKKDNLIPSMTFGYTAGAIYRENGVLGSLTLGGYDASRFIPNDVTFPIATPEAPKLQAALQSISAEDTLTGSIALLSSNITVAIDSTLPYLYLPKASCTEFKRAFGLVFNSDLDQYQLNASAHGQLRKANPPLVFQFGSSSSSVNITVPYQAFDLQTTAPITSNGTNYFPLRCTDDVSQFVLGRAFLQEAYVLADYETGNFSVSQADFSGKAANIVSINHAAISTSTPVSAVPSKSGLSKGAIAGTAIGASAGVILLLSILFFFFRRRRSQKQENAIRQNDISAPIPYNEKTGMESAPSSPSMSNPSNEATLAMSPSAVSPITRLEERLERLERANTTRSPDLELPNRNSYEERTLPPQYVQQELPGSATAAEIGSRSHRASRDPKSEDLPAKPRSARHIVELDASRDG